MLQCPATISPRNRHSIDWVITFMQLLVTVVLFITVFSLPVQAETYSWTDDDGSLHFSDDPGAAPRSARSVETDPTDTSPDIGPEIVGSWSNRKNSFGTLLVSFNWDKTGEMVTAIGMRIPLTWLVRADGGLSLELREPSELASQWQRRRTHTLLAEYDRDRDLILVRSEKGGSETATLYREEDGRGERKRDRPHAPKRFSFGETTVRDGVTGLTWARSLDLPGSYRRHRNAALFLKELSDRGFGGSVDWRLPTVGEMQELVRTLQVFGRESGRCTATGSIPELLQWVGFTNPKGRCYWTETAGEGKGERFAYFLEDGEQRSLGHQQSCGIWPVRGNRK